MVVWLRRANPTVVSVELAMLTKDTLDASAPSDSVIDDDDLVGASRALRVQQLRARRQNLDLIVDHGQLVAGLSDANSRQWGATLGNLIYTWRSGVGIDAHQHLVYVADPEWVSLMTYTGSSPSTITATKLLSNMQRPAYRYMHANTRDFIELDTRR
jgi:hypothetical protein